MCQPGETSGSHLFNGVWRNAHLLRKGQTGSYDKHSGSRRTSGLAHGGEGVWVPAGVTLGVYTVIGLRGTAGADVYGA